MPDQSAGPELEEIAQEKIRTLAQLFLGDFVHRIAVLGSFDTWPNMDYISRRLALNNYVAVTSRYVYRKINGKILRMRTQEHLGFAPNYHFMGELLDQIISDCAQAIINFSVSAAHFIEVDWCYKKSKKTLGVAYVRAISGLENKSCENLKIVETNNGFYSICKPETEEGRTAWDCIKSSAYCPFIGQDISKNVIEYFFRGKEMEIVAVENIEVLPSIVDNRYPPLTAKHPQVKLLDDNIIKDDEVAFTKDSIYFILMLNRLSKGSYMNRLSSMKILALVQRTPGWSDSMSSNPRRITHFVSRHLKSEEPISSLRDGFVDLDRIGVGFENLAIFMKEREYIELKKIEGISGLEGFLAKMKPKGKKLAKMYLSL